MYYFTCKADLLMLLRILRWGDCTGLSDGLSVMTRDLISEKGREQDMGERRASV
jgi:hypothetical protein